MCMCVCCWAYADGGWQGGGGSGLAFVPDLFVITVLSGEMLRVAPCCAGGISERNLFPLP